MPEGRRARPEWRSEVRRPEGQQAVEVDGVPCTAHAHVLRRAPTVPEGRAGAAWATSTARGVRQRAAASIAATPEELRLLLERRRQEARARLQVREQARRWELWRRWAWCRGSCGAAVVQAGARGMMARRRARAERVGAGGGWIFAAGWRDGLVPLGADVSDVCAELETNTRVGDTGSGEVEAGVLAGRARRSTSVVGVAAEARAAERLRAAVRAWLTRRRVAAEVARVRAEWEEPGWLRASALELAELLRVEAAAAAVVAEAEDGKARRRADAKARKRAARAARTAEAAEAAVAANLAAIRGAAWPGDQARAAPAEEARLAAEVELEAAATARMAAAAAAATEAEAQARLAVRAAVRTALASARAAEAEEAAAAEAVAMAAAEARTAAEAEAEAEVMARAAAEAAGALKAAWVAGAKTRRALPRAARGRPGAREVGGAGAEVVMAEEMATEAERHARQMAAWAEEARAAEAATRASLGSEAHGQAGARACTDAHDGWREEVRRNLRAAFERAAARQAGARGGREGR